MGGIFVYLGIFLIFASICIFTLENLEFINIFTNGGRKLSSCALDIYQKWVVRFFTFIFPLATFNFLPLKYILSEQNASFLANGLAPYYGMLFVVPCYLLFRWSLTKYKSSGS